MTMPWWVVVALALAVGLWPGPSLGGDGQGAVHGEGRAGGSRSPSDPEAVAGGAETGVHGLHDVADGVLLLALALRSGRGLIECLDLVGDVAGGPVGSDVRVVSAALRWGVDERAAWALARPEWEPAVVAWIAATSAGIAPADLLESGAERIREQEEDRVAARVQRAAVLLVLPLGGLFLPGFVATTVIPVVLSLLDHGLS